MRGYLAVQSEGGKTANTNSTSSDTTSIAWTLDVYDGDQHRLIRLSGKEVADRLWAANDDPALRRVARAGKGQSHGFPGEDPPAAGGRPRRRAATNRIGP